MIRLYADSVHLPAFCPGRLSGSLLPGRGLLLGLVAGLSLAQTAPLWAQNSIQLLAPAANAPSGSRLDAVSVTFAQPVSGTTPAAAVHVFGTQTDLRTGGVYLGDNTSTFSYNPTAALHPGEQVWVTVAAPGGAGYSPYAYQYTAATGRANAAFGTPPVLLANDIGTRSVLLADINGDGRLDLVTLNNEGVAVFLANPTPPASFGSPTTIKLIDTPESIALVDINNDGKLDLLVGTTGALESKSIAVSLNTGDSATPFLIDGATPRVAVVSTLSLLAADLDRNGQLDIVSVNTNSRQVSIRLNTNGTAQPTSATDLTLAVAPSSLVAADVDNDGAIDLVTVNGDGTLSVLHNDTQGGFSSNNITSLPVANIASRVTAADVDEDGDLDLITANLDDTITILYNTGGDFLATPVLDISVADAQAFDGPMDVKAADVDGDGDLDLLTANFYGSVTVLRNAGRGSFPGAYNAPGASQTAVSSPVLLFTADLNGDTALDVLTMNSNNTITGLLNTAAPLPVSLVRFAAGARGAGVLLSWETATEIQNKGFEVQVSSSGSAFSPLAFVPSAAPNSPARLSYSFLDERPVDTGIRYYRLRQVDLNGQQTFSPVVAVRPQPVRSGISVFPNPFSQQLQVRLPGQPAAPVRVVLRNTLGQSVFSQRISAAGAGPVLTLTPPPALPAGAYTLEVETDGQVLHQRLLKE